MFDTWKDDISGIVAGWKNTPVLSGWKYAPVTEGGAEGQQENSIRNCLASKTFWRTVLIFTGFLLLANLFLGSHAKKGLVHYVSPESPAAASEDTTDWSQFAYCQYVTNEAYLCNSMMIFESLQRLGAKADRIMMYPEQWVVGGPGSDTGRLLAKARDEYGVKLVPITVQHFTGELTWADSFTKLLAFNQTGYKRVLSLDSDATVLQPMDELFILPPAPVAMPRAYWLDDHILSSQLVLVEPSEFEFNRILAAFESRSSSDFDMEIVNDLYGESCFIIPHRRYDLLTGEFRSTEHHKYLGNTEEEWDPVKILAEAKFVHFSDWPHPKPWLNAGASATAEHQPKCIAEDGKDDCRNQETWLWIYQDFRDRRQSVCGKSVAKRDIGDTRSSTPSPWEPLFQ